MTTTALYAAGGWLLLCFVAANVYVAWANYRKAGELDALRFDLDNEHLRNLAIARLLDLRAKRLGVDPDSEYRGTQRGVEA